MRFAYIDSQGNEVSIPSVDALALRIELGAIGPDTQLYDAQADRWGPAESHEIFHTLSRDLTGDGSFVAPPPPMAPPPSVEQPAPPPAAPPAGGTDKPVFDFSMPISLEGDDEDEPAPAKADDLPDFGALSLVDDDDEEEEEAAPPPPPAPVTDQSPMHFALVDEPEVGFAPPPAKAPEPPAEDEPPTFDFGGGLDLAPEPGEPEAPQPGGMDFGHGGFGGGMEMETPMSEFTADAPPSWMDQQDGPGAGRAPLGLEPEPEDPPRHRRTPAVEAAVAAASATEEDGGPRRERPEPRNRPSPPRRNKKFSLTPILLGIVGVGVVGGGGYFGWRYLQGRPDTSSTAAAVPALPPVTIPDIPAELLPRMRDMGEAALSETIQELGAMPAAMELPAEPSRDWLAGVYLANASRFRDVQEFWEGMETFLNRVRDVDTQVFHERYQAQIALAGLAPDTAALLLERADSGFLATRDDRREAYVLMEDLIFAALDLHDFLLRNEANIEHDPAGGGMSRDPVLEAVPNSRELGQEMWSRVDRITKALDALGTLDRVTTERLTAVLFDRIRRAGFR